eukprot:418252_1
MLLFIGYNEDSGEFGDGHKEDINTLTQPEWSKNLKIINVYNGDGFTIYKDSNGILYSAGKNSCGSCLQSKYWWDQCITKATPISLALLNNVKDIYCTGVSDASHGFILSDENILFGYGQNNYGQLGDGTNINKYKLSKIILNNNNNNIKIKEVKCGCYYSLLLLSNG